MLLNRILTLFYEIIEKDTFFIISPDFQIIQHEIYKNNRGK